MWEQFQRYRALDPNARRLFRSAALLLPMIRASLRFRGYKKTQQWLQSRLAQQRAAFAGPASPVSQPDQSLSITCRMVHSAAHYGPIRPTCLEESLALWYFLNDQGILSQLRIGVRKTDGKFEAHAWVEYQGQTLNQSDEVHKHYAAFDSDLVEPPAGSA
jgi:hypothetical protein